MELDGWLVGWLVVVRGSPTDRCILYCLFVTRSSVT